MWIQVKFLWITPFEMGIHPHPLALGPDWVSLDVDDGVDGRHVSVPLDVTRLAEPRDLQPVAAKVRGVMSFAFFIATPLARLLLQFPCSEGVVDGPAGAHDEAGTRRIVRGSAAASFALGLIPAAFAGLLRAVCGAAGDADAVQGVR